LYDASIRMKTLYYMLSSNKLDQKFYNNLIQRIIEKDKTILKGVTKLYINSLVHRERFRLWQIIITILPKLDENSSNELVEYSEMNLVTESQPSIRIIVEWILIKILSTKLDSMDFNDLWKKLENV
jgi:hypothetical protein